MATLQPKDTQFLLALNKLQARPRGKKIIYKDIATKIKFNPIGKNKLPLAVGGKAYNTAIRNEVFKRSGIPEVKPTRQVKEVSKYSKPVTKTIIKPLEKFKNFGKYLIETEGNNSVDDLYNSIMKVREENDELGTDTYVNLIFENNTSNKPRIVAMPSEILGAGGEQGYNNFLQFLDDLDNGLLTKKIGKTITGSDAMNYNDFKLLLNTFSITTMKISNFGSSEDMCFDCVGIVSEEKYCAYECLLKCNIDIGDRITKKQLQNFLKLTEFIKKNNYPIIIISNAFSFSGDFNKNKLMKERPSIPFKQLIGNREYTSSIFNLIDDDIIPNYLYTPEYEENEEPYETHFLIYDEVNTHIDYIGFGYADDVIKFKNNIYLNAGGQVVKNQKILFKPKQIQEITKIITKVAHKFVFFDYETIIDYKQNTCMSEYSLSILVLTTEEVDKLNQYDKDKNVDEIAKMRKEKCVTFLGYDCSIQFIAWIKANQNDVVFTFVGFNNTNFDNFILLDALLRFNENACEEMKVSNIFYNGSQLLDFRLNGRHNTFDIHKHLVGSLSSNCESFKINCCSKKSFDHHKAQLLHKDDKLIDFINNNEELKEYNEYDVLATAVLFAKYREALDIIEATKPYAKDIYKIKTIGSLIYKVFTDNQKKSNIKFPVLEHQQYDDLQKSKIAGRVEMFNGVQKVEERLASTDVCSLYPYVMAVLNCYYPCGVIEQTDSYQGDDKLGFYYCDIDQSCLRDKNLPNIYAYKTGMENKWDYTGVIENYLISNVIIGLLRKFGCNVVIKKGFVFSEKRKSCEMFGFLLDFMEEKNKQDTLKKQKDAKYNPAMRETLKLLMNSLSGKVIEGLHTEKTIDVDSVDTYMKIKETAKSVNFINIIGDKMFMTYEVDSKDIIDQQRPIFLGVFIYDYAKRYMYENSYSKIGKSNLLYTDTDASKFRYRDFITWKKWVDDNNIQVPHWVEVEERDERYKNHKIYESNSKVFGSFEDELEDCIGDEYVFYCLEKKSWLYGWKEEKWESKYRFKGINDNAQILTLEEDFLETKIINHKSKDGVDAWEEEKIYVNTDDETLQEFYESNKHNAIGAGKGIEFFENIYVDGHAYVLCQSFRKIVKNSAREVELDNEAKYNNLMNKIQVNVMMKKITIKR